ncbi:MAG TPA: hypothetical protein VFQ88_15270 [Nevskiaceae bacterium]|nr:hypothetical protein [Nevskiaceae bacterium]
MAEATSQAGSGRDWRFRQDDVTGTVRIKVHRKDVAKDKFVTTTVSIDSVMNQLMLGRMGSQTAVCDWVQGIVDSITEATIRGDALPPVDVTAGVSRLVQRQALRYLFAKLAA